MKHVHHDLIAKWNENNNIVIQKDVSHTKEEWFECDITAVINSPERKFRIKPREFIKGHWYPCIDKYKDKRVLVFNGNNFSYYLGENSRAEFAGDLKFIGKSLGKIKFGDN